MLSLSSPPARAMSYICEVVASPDCNSFVSSSLEALNCALNDSDCLAASLIAPPPNAPVAALDVSFSPFDIINMCMDVCFYFSGVPRIDTGVEQNPRISNYKLNYRYLVQISPL